MGQMILEGREMADRVQSWLHEHGVHDILLVHGRSATELPCFSFFQHLPSAGIYVHSFSDFQPNPLLASAEKGAVVFADEGCDMIVALGGGSAMDVAKVVKLLVLRKGAGDVPFLAIPTTAGTGSEATHFAVVYKDGVKQSVQDDCLLPDLAWFLPEVLASLPIYQRKATALDAFCHAFESFWSIHSNAQSQEYSRRALDGIQKIADGYVHGNAAAGCEMMRLAHLAGMAIDITQTTAGHAMCYELTHLAGIAHGHAAALCVDALGAFLYRGETLWECIDSRGKEYLQGVLFELQPSWQWLHNRMDDWQLREIYVKGPRKETVSCLLDTIHPMRLRNFPIHLRLKDYASLFYQILETGAAYES